MKRAVVLCALLLAGAAHAGGPASPLPLPCGLPQAGPLWVDYADGNVPFWQTFARPGVVVGAANLVFPPQIRAKGAQTVYFDLHLNNRVGTPTAPTDPATMQARADRLFDAAVASSGCDHPLIAENELFGSQTPTPWTPTTAQYRANVLAFLTRLSERGARPFLLLSKRPYTHDETADQWWRDVAQVADLVPEVYFSGPSVSKQGPVLGSRRLRATMRSRIEDLIQIGIPTNRLGMMLTFSSTPGAGGREHLEPIGKWLDVVKWEALAARQVASELRIASVWSWGWATFSAAGNDPEKPLAACTWLWTRDHSLCEPPAQLDRSLEVGAVLPAGTMCVLGKSRFLASDLAALARLTGDRDVAFSAGFQHLTLLEARTVTAQDVRRAEVEVILDHFRGSRAAYDAALARAKASKSVARLVLADELRRLGVERTLIVRAPTTAQVRAWYDTHAGVQARLTSAGLVLAPADRIFALAPGGTATIDGRRVKALGEAAPLGTFPLARATRVVRAALVAEAGKAAFATWVRRRQNQSLANVACQHDQQPLPASVDLTDWLPFLSLR